MLDLSLQKIAHAVDGKLLMPPSFTPPIISSLATDSRTVHRGGNSLFVALKGPVYNAHNYIPELIKKGIRAFLVSEEPEPNNNAAFVWVSDTTLALQKLAAHNRKQFSYPVIGITGSNGKTIVKEWLYDLLSEKYKIVRSPKSYNSQVGVPLSVLLMDDQFDLAIFEAGISQPGEMQHLTQVISPEIGILTNIGDAHQEFFSSLEEKLQEKLLLFTGAQKLICRADQDWVYKQAADFCKENKIEPIFWSIEHQHADLNFSIKKNTTETEINGNYQGRSFAFSIPFVNDSAIENACHCAAALLALPQNPSDFRETFSQLQPVAMRLELKQGINNCTIINDFYNSDLNSLTIALSVLKQQAVSAQQKKVLILSDILQTGLSKKELYSKVNSLLEEWEIDQLIGIGTEISKQGNCFSIKTDLFSDYKEFEAGFNRQAFQSSAILIKGARRFRFERISGLLQQKAHQTVLEINVNALIHNLNVFRKQLRPETKIMVMVKAFSYGSGDIEVARVLQHQNVDYLAVAVADEGVRLRNAGISVPIIVMNPEQDSFQNMIDFGLEPNIYSIELLRNFAQNASAADIQNFPAHLKIDTGMNRLGFKSTEEISEACEFLKNSDALKIKSVFSHLAGSDEAALDDFTQSQFEKFDRAFALISTTLPYHIDRHILNSAGIERFPQNQYEMVRLGIGLYGVSLTGLPVQNMGTLKSTVSQIKTAGSDETVGYNRKGRLDSESKIAIVPVGYADGMNRKLGNRNGSAFIKGQRVPIVGNICMDMLMLDVTGTNPEVGDTVEFFGPHIPITELAEKIGTIPYEILTGISQRVKRIYLQE
ncbi:bifunctional UDP-N-acetylmuramoyl-tripeptide:D-alanyl-D-alanine ligase/alanine racemase [Maribellus sp. CM-23]|uniref:bifunctional UDP-N-acetylmuramoyl-tripeptide:D-alanyl-D-alanine ligase/alanine racemase n=1 Tax=Maribellus sp. CM-23 TaxID=2781026 RepID=UPI001F1864FE|nr:bifunctional UDP-N-acetylmuramoyl-tripeptide:D-alanyl-D-alanine ligase/alanine racemase [Maribellus sp. CM-23]MCE4565577.1 bifunctional UDP-N-acetylmuramoyl-tripeptide:D-alanyl-D-alanine ligase/alanine racemase [Maribellus sp. CM-23]